MPGRLDTRARYGLRHVVGLVAINVTVVAITEYTEPVYGSWLILPLLTVFSAIVTFASGRLRRVVTGSVRVLVLHSAVVLVAPLVGYATLIAGVLPAWSIPISYLLLPLLFAKISPAYYLPFENSLKTSLLKANERTNSGARYAATLCLLLVALTAVAPLTLLGDPPYNIIIHASVQYVAFVLFFLGVYAIHERNRPDTVQMFPDIF